MEGKQVTFTMRLEEDLHKRIRIFALKKGVSVKSLFIECMEKLMAEDEKKTEQK